MVTRKIRTYLHRLSCVRICHILHAVNIEVALTTNVANIRMNTRDCDTLSPREPRLLWTEEFVSQGHVLVKNENAVIHRCVNTE